MAFLSVAFGPKFDVPFLLHPLERKDQVRLSGQTQRHSHPGIPACKVAGDMCIQKAVINLVGLLRKSFAL